MSSILGGGGSSGPPSPPPFNPIDISKIANQALTQDISRYASYQFPVFPGLASVRQAEIEDAYKQLTGPLAPEFQSTFMNNAMTSTQRAVGGGDPFSGMNYQTGSFAKGAASASFTRQNLALEDYNRARFESLLGQNPVPGLGLSQNDLLSMYLYNTGAANASAMSNYSNQIAGANAAYANQVATYNAIGNTIAGLGNIYANYSMYNTGNPGFPDIGS
jgi:hypothetical protein